MKQTTTIKVNKRHTRRKMLDALGNDLVKILTELITNSDDSYKRMQTNKVPNLRASSENPIYINLYKSSGRVEIIDNAEGMNANDIIDNFQSYGADKSGRSEGHKIRGLFGQGATDVLYTQENGKLISIKNNEAVSAMFYWDGDERKIDTEEDLPVDEVRKQYNIPNNGTVISFVLNEKTKFQNNIGNKLSTFYMLRFVINDKRRTILLRQFDEKNKSKDERLYYEFPPVGDGDVLCREKVSFKFEGEEFISDLEINRISEKEDKIKKYGDLQLLVHDDENNVYDNTFFKLGSKYPGMEHLYGYLKMYNTADVIRKKLNAEMPEEILTDSRDGLNIKHDFYKALNEKIEPILEAQASKMINGDQNSLKSDDFKEHKKMFKDLNKYLNEELDEINETGNSVGSQPPADGFAFIRERIKITKGKKYALKLLVNPLIIESGSVINLDYGDDNHISVSPKSVKIKYDKNVGDIVLYSLVVEANIVTDNDCCLVATSDDEDITKKVFISVVDEDIYYPKYGMEFNPNYIVTLPNHDAKVYLYVDINKYPIGTEIKFSSTNKKISINKGSLVLNGKDIIFENVAKIEVIFRSDSKDISGKIIANCKNFLAEADIKIVESIKKDEGKSGLVSGWQFINSPEADWQKYLNPKNGKIFINSGNEINKQYFGDSATTKKVKDSKIFKKYLAELISDEVAKFMVKKQIEKGQLGKDYEEAIEEHQRRKNKIAKIVYYISI